LCRFFVGAAAALSGHEGGGERESVGVRTVVGVGRLAWRCWGRRAVASGLKREVTINMLLGGACGKARGWGGGTRKVVQGGMASATAYTVASVTAAIGNDFPHVSVKLIDPLHY